MDGESPDGRSTVSRLERGQQPMICLGYKMQRRITTAARKKNNRDVVEIIIRRPIDENTQKKENFRRRRKESGPFRNRRGKRTK